MFGSPGEESRQFGTMPVLFRLREFITPLRAGHIQVEVLPSGKLRPAILVSPYTAIEPVGY